MHLLHALRRGTANYSTKRIGKSPKEKTSSEVVKYDRM